MDRTLIVVAYYQTPSTYLNLLYFLRHGIVQTDRCDYIIVVHGESTVVFPPTVKVLRRPNRGYDFGAHAAALASVNHREYDFFIFMNASVIGPLVEPPARPTEWVDTIRERYRRRPDTGILGTTLVCLPPWDAGGEGPRVEGFFWCVNLPRLELLLTEGTILRDHPTKRSAIVEGEYGLSRCMLRHGLNLDCLLRRYEGIDWRDRSTWGANDRRHPSRAGSFYGGSVDPYEVMFHKWYWHGQPTVAFDRILDHIRRTTREALPPQFEKDFDAEAYQSRYPDLQILSGRDALLDHFLVYGFLEGRGWSHERQDVALQVDAEPHADVAIP